MEEKNAVNAQTLYVVATPIGNLSELTTRALHVLSNVDVVYCEDTRVTAKLLEHFEIKTKLKVCQKFNENEMVPGVVDDLRANLRVALVSDAGYPLISDPGYPLVKGVVDHGYKVVPVCGSNAALAALVASGFNAQHFLFYGFLLSKQQGIDEELHSLVNCNYPVIFYEAPHRLLFTLQAIERIYPVNQVCVAKELTKMHETFYRGTASVILKELSDLASIKGEYVIIVQNTMMDDSNQPIDDELMFTEIETLLRENYRLKQAVELVGVRHKVSKNQLYNRFNKHKEGTK